MISKSLLSQYLTFIIRRGSTWSIRGLVLEKFPHEWVLVLRSAQVQSGSTLVRTKRKILGAAILYFQRRFKIIPKTFSGSFSLCMCWSKSPPKNRKHISYLRPVGSKLVMLKSKILRPKKSKLRKIVTNIPKPLLTPFVFSNKRRGPIPSNRGLS